MPSGTMEYNPLGRTDIKVSALGLGVMSFGARTGEDDAFRQMDLAFAAGVTLFDTAENYPAPPLSAETRGRSEEILGRWIKARGLRDRVVIATKVAGPGNRGGDISYIRGPDRRLDGANIRAAVEGSLRRLETDCIDLYQVHWPSRPITTHGRDRFSHLPTGNDEVPIEETLSVLGELVSAGMVRAIGVSNETPWGIMRYLAAAHAAGLPRLASTQNAYSLIERRFEHGLAEIAMREQVGLLAHSPLARGLLAGKDFPFGSTTRPPSPQRLAAAGAYIRLAREYGIEPGGMALAFIRQQPFMTSVLAAGRTAQQIEANLRSLEITLSAELIKQINAIHDAHPNPR